MHRYIQALTNVLRIYFLAILLICNAFIPEFEDNSSTQSFSGFYLPESRVVVEYYAGAWLTSSNRLLAHPQAIRDISFLEQASFNVVAIESKLGKTFMTRDFLDFFVLHLSSAINQFRSYSHPTIFEFSKNSIQKVIIQLHRDIKKKRKTSLKSQAEEIFRSNVVAIIPFSTRAASKLRGHSLEAYHAEMRALFLEATFLSIKKYIDRVIISTATERDTKVVKTMSSIKPWKLLDFSWRFDPNAPSEHMNCTELLPSVTLNYVLDHLAATKASTDAKTEEWSNIRFVYYSEGDQLLYLRSITHLMPFLFRGKRLHVLSPHRMQTFFLPSLLPKEALANPKEYEQERVKSLAAVRIVVEDSFQPVGSCCDNGRFRFRKCSSWWYNCVEFGLRNYSTWLRFGKYGYPTFTGTEHQARCNYTSKRQLCPLSSGCTTRIPYGKSSEYCKEVDSVEFA